MTSKLTSALALVIGGLAGYVTGYKMAPEKVENGNFKVGYYEGFKFEKYVFSKKYDEATKKFEVEIIQIKDNPFLIVHDEYGEVQGAKARGTKMKIIKDEDPKFKDITYELDLKEN